MILGKVTAGIAALIIANFMTPKLLEKIESIKQAIKNAADSKRVMINTKKNLDNQSIIPYYVIEENIVSGHFGSRCESGTVSQQP